VNELLWACCQDFRRRFGSEWEGCLNVRRVSRDLDFIGEMKRCDGIGSSHDRDRLDIAFAVPGFPRE
jgi:hypothetical protein